MNTFSKAIKKERRLIEAVGLWIVVHRKSKCQPHIQENDIFQIVEIGETKNGSKVLTCKRRNSDDVYRINAERFSWEIYTSKAIELVRKEISNAYFRKLRDCQKQQEQEEHKKAVETMMRVFTTKEQIMISFVHLVIAEVAWQYADYCIYYCKENKIHDVKKLNEKFQKMRDDYVYGYLSQSLDKRMRDNITKNAKEFTESKAFKKESEWAFNVIGDAYGKQYPNETIQYPLLRVVAQMGILMVEVYNRQIDKVNKMIDERLHDKREQSAKNIIISEALIDYFDCMQGDYTLEKTPEMEKIICKIMRFIDEAEFYLEKEKQE